MPIFSEMVSGKFYVKVIKPFFDVSGAVVLTILLLPFFLMVSVLVALDLKRSPFFSQLRTGECEKPFNLFKFRTMREDGDEYSTSSFGKFLRSTSLDELPQLVNVMRMEMSFVGPRPLLPEYVPYYSSREQKRHAVKPGITGWAQVNGRNEIDWGKRMELDVTYVKRISLWLDLKILAMTIKLLLKRDPTPYKKGRTEKFSEYASKR